MPPKVKKPNEPSKKTEQKKKEKIIEDKTFGLKNKKGSKQQKFIKTVTHQVKNAGQKVKLEELNKPGDKKAKGKEIDELNKLFKPVQTVGKGVDPKSVVCAFFKQGQCTKGDKCKFSHDLNVSRKSEKKNLYEDVRDDEDKMENWDEQKLEEVVNKKHSEAEKAKPKTSIICKFFLEAVENCKYGWFWTCPNGGNDCKYRHALPPGFVLKRDQKKEEKEEKISIEELVEKERAALGLNTTKVTLETFLKWKERKRKEKMKIQKSAQEKKKSDFKQGKAFGISGREMFEFNPDLVQGDDEEATEDYLEREDQEEDEGGANVKEIDVGMFVPTEIDGTGTRAEQRTAETTAEGTVPTMNGVVGDDEANKMDEAGALPMATGGTGDTADGAIAIAMAATKDGDMNIEIDEDLFDGEDLDAVEEDLETLDLED
ncbi:zinc finger CCCH domain-containing protein 15-like [Mercenaria mercenaria]|uniref:zinc finger CCCH domain-containing protein 15-like n=1 Tax=Mercenaria mercenaria TaxID=6596 RepID=UPI00234F1627|nr:zinc finger CCCH domain-containing protein 15-like [Mercenaria mercenaria]